MGEPSPKSSFAKRPHPQSLLAFLADGTRILDDEPMPSLSTGPMPIGDTMSEAEAAFWRRYNPFLALVDQQRRQAATETLRAASADIESDAAQQIIVAHVQLERQAFAALNEQLRRQSRTKDPRHMSPEQRVIVGAYLCRACCCEATAKHLNQGIPVGQARRGLSRHHVYNAMQRYQNLPGRTRLVVDAEVQYFSANFLALERIYIEAMRRLEFRRLRGSELVRAIHARHDLCELVHRQSAFIEPIRLPRAG